VRDPRPLLSLLFVAGCGTVAPMGVAPDDDDDAADDDDSTEVAPLCPDGLTDAPEGAFIEQGLLGASGTRSDCAVVTHATAGGDGSTLQVTLDGWTGTGGATLEVLDLLGAVVASESGLVAGDSLEVTLDRAGEWLLRLAPDAVEEPSNTYSLDVDCVAGCEARFTRYPVVLVHGMAGADAYLGGYPYWYQVLPDLQADGYLAFTPAVDALAPPPSRAQQWSAILDQLQADGMGRRFNLLGHSQGGIDSRYLASTMDQGARIASITTLATPHYGSGLADVANGVIETTPTLAGLVEDGVSLLTDAIGLGEAQLVFATEAMTRPAMVQFNLDNPDHADVRYFSWSARSCGFTELGCQAEMDAEVIAPYLVPTYRALQLIDGDNDGIVPTESAIWGEHLGTIGADHFDEVGQLAGQTDGNWDHRAFFLGECFRLAEAGL